jgi:chemotaxis protein MotB
MEIKRTLILNRRQQDKRFEEAGQAIQSRLQDEGLMAGLAADVQIVITDDGLRIELMETGSGPVFFDKASSQLTPALKKVLKVVGSVLASIPGDIVVEGHTDALPFGGEGYSNWELSVDRANAARRELQDGGLASARLTEVRGYADRHPKIPDNPLDPRNRRISVLLPYQEIPFDSLKIPGLMSMRRSERRTDIVGGGG